jgi:putative oxidoreductase
MIDAKTAPYAALILRLSTGVLFLLHGLYLKVFVFTMAGTAQFFGMLGLPAWFAWVVLIYETLGGLALILGVYTRYVAAFLGLHMLAVTYIAHLGNGWLFTNAHGGYEYPLFWAVALFALALIGDGAHALRPSKI